jgi:DNA polymerase-1
LDPATSHKLDFLSLKFLGHKMISYEEVTKQFEGKFSKVPLEQAKEYSAEDADVTLQLGEIFLELLQKENLLTILQELEQPLCRILLKMEMAGVRVDTDFLKKLQTEFTQRMVQVEKKIYRLAGEEFNIQSPKQLAVILFEKLKLRVVKKTKTGYSTDVEVLNVLSAEHDLPREILDFRSLAKLKSTYVDALLKQVDSQTQRVHTHYNQTVAETGRLSSNDPNLQNIPIRSEDGAKIRRAFVADEGFVLLSADYSQIELRVLAHFSEDPVLLKAFAGDEDIHRLTAAGVFGVKKDQVTPAMRASGKTLNFAVIYGQTPYGLSAQLSVTQKEAKEYIENYFTKYQGVKKFRDQVLAEARKTGEVRTLMGRRRFTPDLNSKNFGARSLAERIAFNTVIQGTAADIIKKAMIDIDEEMTRQRLSSRMLLQVHDELVFEVKAEELEVMKKLIKEKMEGVVEFKVPLTVEIGEGANWAEAH